MNKSVWQENIKLPEFDTLKGEINTDVLIIGGGLAGILCAYILTSRGINCVLVEGSKIASGITKNTTAKITSQHGLIYKKIIDSQGKNRAQMYLKANQDALLEYETLCKNIDCDYEKKNAYTYSVDSRERIEEEVKAVNSLGFSAEFCDTVSLPFKTKGACLFKNQAQFNPLKFISEISKDLNVYENTFIRDITPTSAISDGGKINFKKCIVATHFPFINKHGGFFLKLYQHRSYVCAYKLEREINGMYVDENLKGFSFREYKDYLLIGGGSHRTGKNGGGYHEIREFAKKYYGSSKPESQWATQDTMSLDGIPYIGRYSKNTPDLYVATGFNKWGMTSAMVSAKILSDMIEEKENEYSEVFSPQRSILTPQLLVNGFETTKNLLTPTAPRCPHLGCALKWNKQERSWDCSCHGSRFEKDGKLIDNPATGDANIKRK